MGMGGLHLSKPSKWKRILLLFFADTCVLTVGVYASMLMRFAPNLPENTMEQTTRYLLPLLASYLGVYALFRMYQVLWRYADARQLIFQALASIVGCGVTLLWNRLFNCDLSRYFLLILCAVAIAATCSMRIGFRMVREYYARRQKEDTSGDGRRLLIAGAGNACSYVISMCERHPGHMGKPVAIADDSDEKSGMYIHGVPVAGKLENIPEIVSQKKITDIIIAMPSLRGERLQQIVTVCKGTHCNVRTLSDPAKVEKDFQSGKLHTREPDISDFLSRGEVKLETEKVKSYISGKTVLVTGGGGSIGSEICRQAMEYKPKQLVVFDIYENCAYELLTELAQKYGADCPVCVRIGSIRDKRRLTEIMREFKPNVVFNAAAHKHVPLMEDSPVEAVKNNIFGTMNVIECASACGCERYVQISTDKAVNPTNVMGATKRVTEMITLLASRVMPMNCMAVRFGNVLGSHGSVIPLFVSQIKNGGPLTLTHPDIERYFMTIPEAAQLVLQTGSMGENGNVYVLDMGSPVKIKDLAEKLIRFYGLEPYQDIEIKITGLRPGEKMYEELLMSEEANQMQRTQHDRIMMAPAATFDQEILSAQLTALHRAVYEDADRYTQEDIVRMLGDIVPTFHHNLGVQAKGA